MPYQRKHAVHEFYMVVSIEQPTDHGLLGAHAMFDAGVR